MQRRSPKLRVSRARDDACQAPAPSTPARTGRKGAARRAHVVEDVEARSELEQRADGRGCVCSRSPVDRSLSVLFFVARERRDTKATRSSSAPAIACLGRRIAGQAGSPSPSLARSALPLPSAATPRLSGRQARSHGTENGRWRAARCRDLRRDSLGWRHSPGAMMRLPGQQEGRTDAFA